MILDDILKAKKQEVDELKKNLCNPPELNLSALPRPLDLAKALKKDGIALIAETKAASPSAGVLAKVYDPAKIAREYEEAGADAISVLTDPTYFMGSVNHLKMVKNAVLVPVLRKDFIIDEVQVYESRMIGADAILLIARILTPENLKKLLGTASSLGLASLVEVTSEEEARVALDCGAEIIGINNRDLETLVVDLGRTISLLKQMPELKNKVVVSESGIKTRRDVIALSGSGVNAILVGEALLRSHDIAEKIEELTVSL